MLGADEDGQMLFFHNELLLYIFKCKWKRETGHLLIKIYIFVPYNQKEALWQCKVKYNNETMKL